MRGAILMCFLAIFAVLTLHYLQLAAQAKAADTGRSDPVVAVSDAYRIAWLDPETGAFESESPDAASEAERAALDDFAH